MDTENVIEMPNRAECRHEWKEEYYGWQCVHCKLFYAFGCAPWEFSEDDDFDTFDGEREDSEGEEESDSYQQFKHGTSEVWR